MVAKLQQHAIGILARNVLVSRCMEPELSDNARRVLEARYLRRDEKRRIVETPSQMFERVARAVAHAETLFTTERHLPRWQADFYDLMAHGDFLPNSPTLMNAGTPLGQLSACFVLPVADNTESIFDALKQMALVQRTGGGTGFSFSALRPRGDFVSSTGSEAGGPVAFMRIFDCATESIRQGGKRRGANMGVLRVDHPDIEEFIACKLDGVSMRNFNISVGVTDAFMQAARDDAPYALIDPRTGQERGELSAGKTFRSIVEAAWSVGDPGLLFLDAIARHNPVPALGRIEATNPCGEIPLAPYEACTLGSINLAHMLRASEDREELDEAKLRSVVHRAVRFLDDVIEVNHSPVPEIRLATRSTRKIGLGVMGFAEMLIRMRIPYDSDDAVRAGERVMRLISAEALETSKALAEERGVFPSWGVSVFARQEGLRVRNATRTAIAPTGTLSILAGTSASIEPLFALAYRRINVLEGQKLVEVSPLLRQILAREGLDPEPIVEEMQTRGRLGELMQLPDRLRRTFVTALEIPPLRHLQVQAAFQRNVDNSVSKTINVPRDTTPSEIALAYFNAWELGLKGVTVFRYGSKSAQVLELGIGSNALAEDHASRCDPEECRLP